MKKLIAIDGNSLMHRAYYALPSMTNKAGTPTGAVYGFMSMLVKLIAYEPDYLLVAFDMHGPTFRHEMYAEYKAGRRATPEDLRPQFPILQELLRAMHITVCECESYEADDILGTFSRIANREGVDALLVTGDRDALQLITPQTHVLLTKKGITETVEYDEARLMEDYGLTPARMPDLKGLMGDNSDHIPGIPGVGEKTALTLLKKYETLEGVLSHAEDEKGALREKLLKNGDLARMSYTLGVIDTAAPVTTALADCAFKPEAMANGLPLMQTLELRSLIARMPQGGTRQLEQPPAMQEIETVPVRDEAALREVAAAVQSAKQMALYLGDTLYVAADAKKQYAMVLEATLLDAGLDAARVYEALRDPLEDAACQKLLFDAKAMEHTLARHGIALTGVTFDAMLADYLLHAIHPTDSLSALCGETLHAQPGASVLFTLRDMMERQMQTQGMTALYRDMELPLSHVLFTMEEAGFAVDAQQLNALGTQFGARIGDVEKEIYALAGEPFNILSPKQLGAVLFEKLGLPVQKKTKSGYSTDAEVMEKLMEQHAIVPLVTEYRFLCKLKSTFVDALIAKASQGDGRIRSSFNQNVTATGRISSTEPNLQNIPVRTELGREIRRAFIASPGCILVDADYSQIELRLLAHMSGDAGMIEAFRAGDDIHTRTASEVFGVPLQAVTKQQRSAAKAVNFGIVYGISDFGLARNLGISRKTAGEYIAMYLERYPGVQAYMKKSVEDGKAQGYVCTLMGRRRELPEIRSANFNTRAFGERVALNMPIQGTAADIIKLAMVRVYEALKENGLQARLILQVHDELIVDAPIAEAETVKAILKDRMQDILALSVPLIADIETGYSWYDAK